MTDPVRRPDAPEFPMGFREFVALIAAIMAINALSIDSMLPALPAMGDALHIPLENQRQWIISAYVLGFGSMQIVYGPISDWLGRRPVLLVTLVLYALATFAALLAHDFASIIVARVLQGVFAAASRVLVVSIVRDRYSGRQMARVMSLSFVVFLAVPILAPSIGQLIMLTAPWEGIFVALGGFTLALTGWAWARLPETLHPEDRRPIEPASIMAAARIVIGNRASLGYTLATTMLFGALLGYISSSQQIFAGTFHEPTLFTALFAATAAVMGVASYLNSRIVERLGTRVVSHGGLLGFVAVAGVHLLLVRAGVETLASFAVLQGLSMACFSLATSNFSAMAMEEVGHVAGTAASIQGSFTTVTGGLLGAWIGQHYDGTTAPLVTGYLLLGLSSLAIVMVTERGRLFRPHHPAGATA